jgi:hypothetical protein
MARKEKTETTAATPDTVHPWAYPAYAASRSTKAGKAVTHWVAPVTRVVAVPVAIVGAFGWGLVAGTWDELTVMPVLPVDPALAGPAALAEQLGVKPGQPLTPATAAQAVAQATASVAQSVEANERRAAAALAGQARIEALLGTLIERLTPAPVVVETPVAVETHATAAESPVNGPTPVAA